MVVSDCAAIPRLVAAGAAIGESTALVVGHGVHVLPVIHPVSVGEPSAALAAAVGRKHSAVGEVHPSLFCADSLDDAA